MIGTRRANMAHLNKCGECVGGETGLPETEGMNVCDQCLNDTNADETSCLGCDGVPKRYGGPDDPDFNDLGTI